VMARAHGPGSRSPYSAITPRQGCAITDPPPASR
jgi:hypothetical protein